MFWCRPANVLQLLMVPTPFFVGVCTSFMKKVNEVHRSETWIVDLDSKKVRTHGSVFTLSEQADN